MRRKVQVKEFRVAQIHGSISVANIPLFSTNVLKAITTYACETWSMTMVEVNTFGGDGDNGRVEDALSISQGPN